MRDEITIPVQKVEDFVSAEERRRKYSAKRDAQALEFNEAIASRLIASQTKQVKCEKCGREFAAGHEITESLICPDCK